MQPELAQDAGELALIVEILKAAKLTVWAAEGEESDFAIRLWSPGAERVYGYTRDEALGRNYVDLFVNAAERDQAVEDHARIVANNEEYEWDWAADDIAKDGSVHTMLTNCFPVVDPRTGRSVLAEIGVDISKKEQASAKLRKLQAESLLKAAKSSNVRWMAAVELLYSTVGRLSSAEGSGVAAVTRAAVSAVKMIVGSGPSVRVWLQSGAGSTLAEGSDPIGARGSFDEEDALAKLKQAEHPEAMFVDSQDRSSLFGSRALRGKVRAAAVIPIQFGLQLRGLVAVHFGEYRRISDSERSALAHLGLHIGVGLEMAAELQRWRESDSIRIRDQAVQRFLRLVFHRVGGAAYVLGEDLRALEVELADSGADELITNRVRTMEDRTKRIEAALEDFRNERDTIHEVRTLPLRAVCLAKTVDLEHTHPTVRVGVDMPADLRVETSEFLLAEALSNLLVNAAEEILESDGGGDIRLSAERVGKVIELRVEDSGRGIPPESRDEVFAPGRTTKGNGHGYGLAYARDALQLAEGDLTLSATRGEFGGACFVVTLKAPAGN